VSQRTAGVVDGDPVFLQHDVKRDPGIEIIHALGANGVLPGDGSVRTVDGVLPPGYSWPDGTVTDAAYVHDPFFLAGSLPDHGCGLAMITRKKGSSRQIIRRQAG
jgi:hypothetical protein